MWCLLDLFDAINFPSSKQLETEISACAEKFKMCGKRVRNKSSHFKAKWEHNLFMGVRISQRNSSDHQQQQLLQMTPIVLLVPLKLNANFFYIGSVNPTLHLSRDPTTNDRVNTHTQIYLISSSPLKATNAYNSKRPIGKSVHWWILHMDWRRFQFQYELNHISTNVICKCQQQ